MKSICKIFSLVVLTSLGATPVFAEPDFSLLDAEYSIWDLKEECGKLSSQLESLDVKTSWLKAEFHARASRESIFIETLLAKGYELEKAIESEYAEVSRFHHDCCTATAEQGTDYYHFGTLYLKRFQNKECSPVEVRSGRADPSTPESEVWKYNLDMAKRIDSVKVQKCRVSEHADKLKQLITEMDRRRNPEVAWQALQKDKELINLMSKLNAKLVQLQAKQDVNNKAISDVHSAIKNLEVSDVFIPVSREANSNSAALAK